MYFSFLAPKKTPSFYSWLHLSICMGKNEKKVRLQFRLSENDFEVAEATMEFHKANYEKSEFRGDSVSTFAKFLLESQMRIYLATRNSE